MLLATASVGARGRFGMAPSAIRLVTDERLIKRNAQINNAVIVPAIAIQANGFEREVLVKGGGANSGGTCRCATSFSAASSAHAEHTTVEVSLSESASTGASQWIHDTRKFRPVLSHAAI